jgi:ATP-binding cassette, subfamily B, bacterial
MPASSSNWRPLAALLRPMLGRVLVFAAVLAAGSALPLAGPQLLRAFIDRAVAGRPPAVLAGIAGAYIAVALAGQALAVAATYGAARLAWTTANRLRAELAGHALGQDLSFHGAHPPGELIERVDGDVTSLSKFLSSFAPSVVGNGLTLVGVLVVVAVEDWRVGLALAAFVAATAVVVVGLRNTAVPQAVEERAATARLLGGVEERLAGAEDLRALAGGAHALRRHGRAAAALYRAADRATRAGARLWVVSMGVYTAGGVLSLGLGAWLYHAGAITLGTVYLLFGYTELLRRPLERIVDQLQEAQESVAGVARVGRLLAARPSVAGGGHARLPDGPLAVELDHVDAAYEDGVPVLEGVSLRLAPGTLLGVVGRSGSGKTTLGRLLLRLLDPGRGAVRLGGVDLRDADPAGVRARVGLVPQDVQLFRASLRDNLTLFGARPAGDERLAEVLDGLGLGRWWRALPDGLETLLGPGGAGASAGEAQLVAFARVFLRDPGLVVLDEAAARVDPASQARIERAVGTLLHGRTAVVVAHRLGTVAHADELLVLDRGRVVEHGPPAALAADPSSRFAGLLAAGREGAPV